MHKYRHALTTRVLQLAANCNDGAMRDFLVEGLSPLPHSGGNKSNVFQQAPLEMCTDDPESMMIGKALSGL